MKKLIYTAIAGLFMAGMAHAQPNIQIAWQRTIGGSAADNMQSMAKTPDGGYLLAGESNSNISGEKSENNRGLVSTGIFATADFWILKTNDTGGIQWQKTIGGNMYDRATSVAATADGGYIVGGTSRSGISGEKTDTCRGGQDYWVVKLNSTGTIQWQKTFGGTHNNGATIEIDGNDDLQKVIQTSDGGYMVAGFSSSGINGDKTDSNRSGIESFDNDYWVLKLDATGNILWQKTIGGSDDDRLYSLIQTLDGGYLLGGQSFSNISGDKTTNVYGIADYWVVKLSAAGTIQWDKNFGGDENDILWSMCQLADSSYVLAGQSFSTNTGIKTDTSRGSSDYWVVKINAQGNLLWNKAYGGDDYDWATDVIPTQDGGLLIHGNSRSANSGDKTEMGWGDVDYWTIKTDAMGTIQWQKALGGNWIDQTFHSGLALETNQGDFVLGGYSFSGISGNKTDTSRGGFGDYWIVKIFEDCPDTTEIAGTVCSAQGYLLPWGTTVYTGGTYTNVYPPVIEGSKCDSVVTVTLTGLVDTAVTVTDSTLTAQDPSATYQWIDCSTGLPVSGATSASFTAPANTGSYAVIVTANGCSDTSDCYDLGILGISGTELNRQFSIYPNPANTKVHILNKSGIKLQSISITNILGAKVYQSNAINKRIMDIDVAQLPSGIYTLQVAAEKGTAIYKLEILK
jgi:hypothetical protein